MRARYGFLLAVFALSVAGCGGDSGDSDSHGAGTGGAGTGGIGGGGAGGVPTGGTGGMSTGARVAKEVPEARRGAGSGGPEGSPPIRARGARCTSKGSGRRSSSWRGMSRSCPSSR